MYDLTLHKKVNERLPRQFDIQGKDNSFYARLIAGISELRKGYDILYGSHPAGPAAFDQIIESIINGYVQRPPALRKKDLLKKPDWFLSNELAGMSLYVDRFAGDLKGLGKKLDYFEKLGVNLLHLMPVFESPADAGDGGYAVSDFRKVDAKFGTLDDLTSLRKSMDGKQMYLMLDIVLNHTSDRHPWAKQARAGDQRLMDYYYFFDDRHMPDVYDETMPEIFPEAAPGNFTFVPELNKWVMTVFHRYQWDLNYRNPWVLVSMLDNILFYANLGVDILRIDAPAFIWKQPGTSSQNLPEAHLLLRLIRQCVRTTAPGMAILGEAIVSPAEIMKYFGTGDNAARECDFAYNATQMALQWDAMATGDTGLMLQSQHELLQKPRGTSWITYTRSHDDIGFGFGDDAIIRAGFEPFRHRGFLKDFFSGAYPGSFSGGALFSQNPKTGDARVSGTLASLCGLETALKSGDTLAQETAVRRVLLMQAMSFFTGGIPMLFAGDETGTINDYGYLEDPAKNYDNRWMHRARKNWDAENTPEAETFAKAMVFEGTKKLLAIRGSLPVLADHSNVEWLYTANIHVAGFVRAFEDSRFYALFNFSAGETSLSWHVLNRREPFLGKLKELWTGKTFIVGPDHEPLIFSPYQFYLFSRE